MDLAAFLGICVLVIVTPGQDTALTIRNSLLGGRSAGVFTALGVSAGQAVWAVATSFGIAAVVAASEPAFLVLRLLGAAYLIYLGGRVLYAAIVGFGASHSRSTSALNPRVAFRQGLVSNLGNPKMAVFFTSLLPQFAAGSIGGLLALGLLFCALTFVWLGAYAAVVARVGDILRRPAIRRSFDAVTGAVLVALGLRLAAERR